jgi:hypothetical protein
MDTSLKQFGTRTALLWILVSIIGWVFFPLDRFAVVRAYAEIPRLLLAYSVSGAVVGLVLGTAQAWVVRRPGYRAHDWVPTTVAAYGLGLPLGLIGSLLIAVLSWRVVRGEALLPLTAPAGYVGPAVWPYMNALVIGGGLVGLIQWRLVRRLLPYPKFRMAALWVFGCWLAIGLGVWLGPIPALLLLPPSLTGDPLSLVFIVLAQMGTGLVSGAISGLVLLILVRESRRTSGWAAARMRT